MTVTAIALIVEQVLVSLVHSPGQTINLIRICDSYPKPTANKRVLGGFAQPAKWQHVKKILVANFHYILTYHNLTYMFNCKFVNVSKTADKVIEHLVELGQVANCAANSRRQMQTRDASGKEFGRVASPDYVTQWQSVMNTLPEAHERDQGGRRDGVNGESGISAQCL